MSVKARLLWVRSVTARFSSKVDSLHRGRKARGHRPHPQRLQQISRLCPAFEPECIHAEELIPLLAKELDYFEVLFER
jgi:hypothetical protein